MACGKRPPEWGEHRQRLVPSGSTFKNFEVTDQNNGNNPESVARQREGFEGGGGVGECEGIKALITDGRRISSFQPVPLRRLIDRGMVRSLLSARVSVKQERVLGTMAGVQRPV